MQSMPEEVPLQPEDESSLERLRARLYAQEAPPQFVPPTLSSAPLSPEAARLPQNFSELKKPEIPPSWITRPKPEPQKPRISWAVLFFGFAVLFFVLAGVGSYVFLIMGG